MKVRALLSLLSVFLVPAAVAARVPADGGPSTEPEQFQVAQKTEVPNATLQPGNYSIRVLDHLRDRVILQVAGKGNHVQTTFIAIPAATMANAPVGPIAYSAGPKGQAAMKGFSFPGGLAVEFVYPKNDAVSIAQANDTRVMAIDPASEGRATAPNLSQNDMQMITLWMLEPSRVGANEAKPSGISATKYQAPPQAASAPVETAQSQSAPAPAPASSYAPASSATSQSAPQPRRASHRSQPVQVAQNDAPSAPATHVRPAGVKALPHTASDLPLLWMVALISLLLGGSLSLRRFASNA